MEYETVGAAVDGSAVGQPKYKVKSKRKPLEVVMNTFFLCGMVAVAFVLIISVYLVISGMPAILEIGPINFLFGTRWYASTNDFGILAIILTSFAGTAGAIIIGVPIGLMTAIFLAKVANPKLAKVVHTAVELLAGIPSVVYGLVGMILLVPAIRVAFNLPSGATLLAAIIVLSVMILPSIISVSETSLRAVPREYEEASLALGATHIETMVAGNVANMPGLLTPVRFLTTAIASEMSYASVGSTHRNALFSIGLVLFLFIMMINVFLNVFIKNKKEG